MRHSATLAIALTCFISASASGAQPGKSDVTLPFRISQHDGYGRRPVVDATINGKPFHLVVHSNSAFYLQINHAEAKSVAARDLKHVGAYGISSPGHVSGLGMDNGYVDHLALGNWSVVNAPVTVFEMPANSAPGMLGLGFLSANNVIVDFDRNTIAIPGEKPSEALAEEMRRRGYASHAMYRDPKLGRYMLKVSINGVATPMSVSTVATVSLDTAYAKRAHVDLGKPTGEYAGPSGATGQTYALAKPVRFQVDSWMSPDTHIEVEDLYAYGKIPRPTDDSATGGNLGADFMINNKAVIDFGNSVLYLKNN